MKNKSIEPLILTNADKAKNERKRLIGGLIILALCLLVFSLLSWDIRCIIVCVFTFIMQISIFIDYRKSVKAVAEVEEYLRIDEKGVQIKIEGESTFILWNNVLSATFYSWHNHKNLFHLSIRYKERNYVITTRINLSDYNEIVSCRKWKKAIIHFSGREDIVGNKHTWLVFAKEDND